MECCLCRASLSAKYGKNIVDKDVWKLLETRLNCKPLEDLQGECVACGDCFSCYEELCSLCVELSKVKNAIKNVVEKLKLRLTQPEGLAVTAKSRNEGNDASDSNTSSSSLPLTNSYKTEQTATTSLFDIKYESDESNGDWTDASEICDVEVSGANTDDEFWDESQDFIKQEESEVESMVLDDTEEFILGQLLSESDSESETETPSAPKPTKERVKQKQKTSSSTTKRSEAKALMECELCFPEKKTFPSKTDLSRHYEMDHRDTQKVFLCENFGCDSKLLTFELLEIHKKSHLQLDEKSTAEDPMLHRSFCCVCRRSSNFPHVLRLHELKEHSAQMKYSCPICKAMYFNEDVLNAHQLSHSEDTSRLECSLCPNEWKTQFEDGDSLDSHLIRMHNFLHHSKSRKKAFKEAAKTFNDRSDEEDFISCENCGRTFPRKMKSRLRHHQCKPRRPVYCELCNKKYSGPQVLLQHVAKVHEGNGNESQFNPELKCIKCSKLFATTLMYKRHVNCHNLETKFPFYCSPCELRFPTDTLLSDHNKVQHSKSPKKGYISCSVCGKNAHFTFNLRKHERESHPEIFIHRCTKCEATFAKPEFLETHLKTHQSKGPFNCSVCPSKSYLTAAILELHLKQHHTVGFAKSCAECGDEFGKTHELTMHMHVKHGKPLPEECHICSKRFSCPVFVKMHINKVHANEETKKKRQRESRVQCEVCQKWVMSKCALQLHIKSVHERSTVQVCEVCGKSINGASAMKDHMKIHREEKNFACDFCDKRFVRRDALRMHTYTHTGEKPFGCYICDKRFNQRTPLKRHVELHKKDGSWFPKPNAVEQEESSNSMQQD